jgi:mono/diheme cytochrome c family protein
VRLEAIVAASWLPDTSPARRSSPSPAAKPLDVWSQNAAKTAADRLAGIAEVEKPEFAEIKAPAHLSAEKAQFMAGQKVYFREGHCGTCHQPMAKASTQPSPRMEKSPWVAGDPDRLIKLAMYGLMGPLEVNGKKYDGQVPMTPFAGMLKDDEMAAVLTFVRNSFGNKSPGIQPAQIQKVRDANPGRLMFYMTDELLKQHPLEVLANAHPFPFLLATFSPSGERAYFAPPIVGKLARVWSPRGATGPVALFTHEALPPTNPAFWRTRLLRPHA